jgi:hypothetical protein
MFSPEQLHWHVAKRENNEIKKVFAQYGKCHGVQKSFNLNSSSRLLPAFLHYSLISCVTDNTILSS